MNDSTIVQIPDFGSLDKVVRKIGIEALAGRDNGVPVLTVTVKRIKFVAVVHNQCLKLMYRWTEDDFPGGVVFANQWNMLNLMGTLIPMTDGFVIKHESLATHGLLAGNLRDTLISFAAAVDKFQDEWIAASSLSVEVTESSDLF